MRRFFIHTKACTGDFVPLADDESHHLRNVLRMGIGDVVELFDGQGAIYTAEIKTISPEVRLEILSRETVPLSMPALHVAQGILQGKKMDFLIQKASELGIASVQPFQSQHASLRNPSTNKINRWQKIAFEASKQCRRPQPMTVKPVIDLEDLINSATDYALKIVLWEQEKKQNLQDLPSIPSLESVLILIGPEGGFAHEEIKKCHDAGFTSIGLGSLILRAETASISAMAILQFLAGNLQ